MDTHDLLIRLLVAHFVADFLIQPKRMVESKMARSWKSGFLYLHVVIHMILSLLLIWNVNAWPWILLIGASHLLIDLIKIFLNKRFPAHNSSWFILDQAAHIGVLMLIVHYYGSVNFEFTYSIQEYILTLNWSYVLGAILLTTPTALTIKGIMRKFPLPHSESTHGLENAGLYIGVLERLLTYIFILTGHWEAVGFLIAAKSIFRFGDLREQKDIRLTEYILIGTLLSFSIAIFCALVVQAMA